MRSNKWREHFRRHMKENHSSESETPRGRATGHQKTKNQKLTVGYDDTQYNAL